MANAAGLLRYTLRQFSRARLFTVTVVLTLALGIGGTTAIFTLIHAVMLRSLPVTDPASLYRIGGGDDCCVEGGPQDHWGMFSFPLFERLKAAAPEFEDLTVFQAGRGRLSVRRAGIDTVARPLRSEYVSGSYFSTFGVAAFGGRVLTPDDDVPSATPVAVLSHHAWEGIYGADPAVVGAVFTVDGHPMTIVGIAPPGFFGDTLQSDPPDVWMPLQQEPMIAGRGTLLDQPSSAWLRVIGRLRPGASIDGLGARLTGVLRQWMQTESGYPANWMADVVRLLPGQTIDVVPAGAGVGVMKDAYARSLQILLAVCGLVLLIACANAANLLLARAVSRRTDTAVRLAVGARRAHIVTEALVESVLLAAGGGLVGLVVASGTTRLLLSLAFEGAAFLPIDTRPSGLVLAFACGLALATGIVFGAVPAWFATRTDPVDALRGAGRSTSDRSARARKVLLAVQATLSVVLVAGAMMLARSVSNLERQNFGYAVDGRVVVSLNKPPADYTTARLRALYREIQDRLTRIPGVTGAGLALYNPLTDNWGELILVSGHPPPQMSAQAGASWDRVSADYLRDFGMTIRRGRGFTDADDERAGPVAVVNESFVARFFASGEDPIGQHFGMDVPENAGTFRIIGVVGDAKFAGFDLDRPARPMFYVPLAQAVAYTNPVMARIEEQSHFVRGIVLVTSLSPGALEPVLTRTLGDVDPNLTMTSVRTMADQVALSFDRERAVAALASLFGAVALLLAAIGLYGVLAYTVAQRTNEIGIRMALGADRPSVVRLVMRTAFLRVVAGLLLGLPLAVGAGKLIVGELYGVSFWDPLALLVAVTALLACACLAAVVPAMRAASISPTRALRNE